MAMFDDPRKYLRKMDEELRAERAAQRPVHKQAVDAHADIGGHAFDDAV